VEEAKFCSIDNPECESCQWHDCIHDYGVGSYSRSEYEVRAADGRSHNPECESCQ